MDNIDTPQSLNQKIIHSKSPINNHRLIILLFFASLIGIIIAIFFAFKYYRLSALVTNQSKNNQNPVVSDTGNKSYDTSGDLSPADLTADKPTEKLLLFSRNPNPDKPGDAQAWLMSVKGLDLKRLETPGFLSIFKQLSSNLVFFIKTATSGTLSVKNIANNEITEYSLINHPKPEVNEYLLIDNLKNIAHDDSYLVYNVMFTEPCQDTLLQGGSGPCFPDPDPNFPDGSYLYNLNNKENTYLGGSVIVSRWDLKNSLLYFISLEFNKTGLYSVNLQSKVIKLEEKSETFGYGAYPLFSSDLLIKFEGTTENPSMSRLSLTDRKTNETRLIGSGTWAEIQPFASISPDETSFLYIRSTSRNGFQYHSLYLYDLTSSQLKRITPSSTSESYSINGIWIDNESFVTLVDTIEENAYHNDNNYLVSINTKTGQISRLTENNDVYRFNK